MYHRAKNIIERRFKMKKLLVALILISLIAGGAIAYGHGWGGYGTGHGYGGHMMGQMTGGHMMGPMWGGYGHGYGYGYDQKFLDETRELRKQLHDKRFEYHEAIRNPETTTETLIAIEKEIRELKEEIYEKSPRRGLRGSGGYGPCW